MHGAHAGILASLTTEGLSALERVLGTHELLSFIVSKLARIEDRIICQRTCSSLLHAAREPELWTSVHAEGLRSLDMLLSSSWDRTHTRSIRLRVLEPINCGASLTLRQHVMATGAQLGEPAMPLQGLWPPMPALEELDIQASVLPSIEILTAALWACGGSLSRLDLTGVRLAHGTTSLLGVQSTYQKMPLGWVDSNRLGLIFEPLVALDTLVIRDVELDDDARANQLVNRMLRGRRSFMITALRRLPCKERLQTIALGWASEFTQPIDPALSPEFTDPILCSLDVSHHVFMSPQMPLFGFESAQPPLQAEIPMLGGVLPAASDLWGAFPRLTHISFAGYALVHDGVLHELSALPLVTLDLCGCRCLSERGLAHTLGCLSPTLISLNVRATSFGDAAAIALAGGEACSEASYSTGCLTQLNASCCERLHGAGLAALSVRSRSLRVLDLCYSAGISSLDVIPVVRRHPGLEMLGLGGFISLTMNQLSEILILCGTTMRHLGIGGCKLLDGNIALSWLPQYCPKLTALSAHKLLRVRPGGLLECVLGCSSLRSLDVHGCVDEVGVEANPSDPSNWLAHVVAEVDKQAAAGRSTGGLRSGQPRAWRALASRAGDEHWVAPSVLHMDAVQDD